MGDPGMDLVSRTLLKLAHDYGPAKTFSPLEAAKAMAGPDPQTWGPLLQQLRRAAIGLAKSGRLVIYRKGRPADPDAFKGTYRLGLPRLD